MKLEGAENLFYGSATEADIDACLADDNGRGEFVILSDDATDGFMQASGGDDGGPFDTLEYSENGELYQCEGWPGSDGIPREIVRSAFVAYLNHDESYKSMARWTPYSSRPWWKRLLGL